MRTIIRKKHQQKRTKNNKKLILSFETGDPNWSLFPNKVLKNLPAIKWKLLNIRKLKDNNPIKHKDIIQKLTSTLGL